MANSSISLQHATFPCKPPFPKEQMKRDFTHFPTRTTYFSPPNSPWMLLHVSLLHIRKQDLLILPTATPPRSTRHNNTTQFLIVSVQNLCLVNSSWTHLHLKNRQYLIRCIQWWLIRRHCRLYHHHILHTRHQNFTFATKQTLEMYTSKIRLTGLGVNAEDSPKLKTWLLW